MQSIKRDDAGGTSVITKGDANPGPDPWTAVLSDDYVYTKAAVLPYLGDLIRAMRQPIVQSMLLYGGFGPARRYRADVDLGEVR